ncbi:sulfite exporter TauE/SafE family protein [Saccharopolyspora rhizosphaerae]|uniref:Probable membrane transporter protein n=1 Tax=Saccharopolyspora rhizosphaerae TaxID=2492662 RepID=A0A3R8R2F0_9PSEU|nr:sulfite exporter TauE/SafE family protein [Saccharopolyspora rhizosphaerae]RRO16651.1 sulfite exporter TauE/SafE family protein [Saccharopolyspora rhizosphaerae]
MDLLFLGLVGVATGVTTVLFGFGGGFVTVPVIMWVDADLGESAAAVAVATSSVVMVVNAGVATSATRRVVLRHLLGAKHLCALLAVGGAVGALLAGWAPAPLIHWGFVAYLGATLADVVLRPGFLRQSASEVPTGEGLPIRSSLGVPIGALASFLGVGGSVMTVPLLRRGGMPMAVATPLANPLTFAISLPALVVFLLASPDPPGAGTVGLIDLRSAMVLLVTAIPVIVLLRRRPPPVGDTVHAAAYVGLLLLMTIVAMGAGLR